MRIQLKERKIPLEELLPKEIRSYRFVFSKLCGCGCRKRVFLERMFYCYLCEVSTHHRDNPYSFYIIPEHWSYFLQLSNGIIPDKEINNKDGYYCQWL